MIHGFQAAWLGCFDDLFNLLLQALDGLFYLHLFLDDRVEPIDAQHLGGQPAGVA